MCIYEHGFNGIAICMCFPYGDEFLVTGLTKFICTFMSNRSTVVKSAPLSYTASF